MTDERHGDESRQPSSGGAPRIDVRRARYSDIDGIMRLARSWEPGERSNEHLSRHGFLVSNYRRSDYETLLDVSELVFVAEIDGILTGFLAAYPGDKSQVIGDYSAIQLEKTLSDFVVSKQIGVSPAYVGLGVAQRLYGHLFSLLRTGQVLIAATVDEPPNHRSRDLHSRLGFTDRYHIQHPDGLPRTVWEYVRR